MALQYFEFYRGNLATGFDYIYAKQTDQYAFYLRVPATMNAPIMDVTDPTFVFMREQPTDAKWRQFATMWQDVSFQWPNIERKLMATLPNWQADYRQVQPGATDEWGLIVQFDDQPDVLRFGGVNAFPEDFAAFEKWINSYDGGRLR